MSGLRHLQHIFYQLNRGSQFYCWKKPENSEKKKKKNLPKDTLEYTFELIYIDYNTMKIWGKGYKFHT